ncbi:hypothetical protein M427DRAFT_143540, partial [Gonapodya prolifera JEL478]
MLTKTQEPGRGLLSASRVPSSHAFNPNVQPDLLDSPTFSASQLFPALDTNEETTPYLLDLPPPAYRDGYEEVVKTRYYSRSTPKSSQSFSTSSSLGLSKVPPRRSFTHPVYLSPVTGDAPQPLIAATSFTRIEPFIEADMAKQSPGIFVPAQNIKDLGLKEVGEEDTRFGIVRTYEAVVLHLFTRHITVPVTYALP